MTLPDDVTDADVTRYSKLAGVRKALDKKYGAGSWGREQVALYVHERKQAKLAEAEKPPAPRPTYVSPATFQAKLDEYLAAFDRVTPNDRQSFMNLVSLEINLDRVRDRLNAEDISAEDYAKLVESQTKMSREHRQLQDGLGIGRARRKSEASAQDEIEKLRAGAARFLARQTVRIECRACRTTINLGFLALHFRDEVPWLFQQGCPKCSAVIRLAGALELPPPPTPTVYTIE